MASNGQRPLACYRPDGSAADARYAACNTRAGTGGSMCCRTNDTAASFPDVCRSDGLCQETQDTSIVWRESCTDPTWRAPGCVQICVDGSDRETDIEITFCADGSLCCGRKNTACCDGGRGVWRVGNTTTSTKPDAPSNSTAPLVSTTSLAPTTTAGANSTSPPASLPTGSAIGIGVGIGGVVVVMCAVLVFWTFKKRKARHGADAPAYYPPPLAENPDPWKHRAELVEIGAHERSEIVGAPRADDENKFVRPQSPAELYGTEGRRVP